MKCTDPLHDDRNDGLWHRWENEQGQRFAAPCPVNHPMAQPKDEDEPPKRKRSETGFFSRGRGR